MPLGLRKIRKTGYKRPANRKTSDFKNLCKPHKALANRVPNRVTKPCPKPVPPCAPWGAYALTHRDKLWGVNIIKVSALCGKLPIDIIKGFPRNITKHTKRNILRHSTNPCGKPSFLPIPFLPPWGGLYANAPNQTLMGWIQSLPLSP